VDQRKQNHYRYALSRNLPINKASFLFNVDAKTPGCLMLESNIQIAPFTGFNTIQCLLVVALFLGHSVNIT